MSDAFWQSLPTIISAFGTFVSVILAFIVLLINRKQNDMASDVKAVKQSTDGLLHRAVAEAEEKGRGEGAAIATAGAAAVTPPK